MDGGPQGLQEVRQEGEVRRGEEGEEEGGGGEQLAVFGGVNQSEEWREKRHISISSDINPYKTKLSLREEQSV